jgi:hypothetical protein
MGNIIEINYNTELQTGDSIKNREGTIYKIDINLGNTHFRIYQIDTTSFKGDPIYHFISKEAMILNGWIKVVKKAILNIFD